MMRAAEHVMERARDTDLAPIAIAEKLLAMPCRACLGRCMDSSPDPRHKLAEHHADFLALRVFTVLGAAGLQTGAQLAPPQQFSVR